MHHPGYPQKSPPGCPTPKEKARLCLSNAAWPLESSVQVVGAVLSAETQHGLGSGIPNHGSKPAGCNATRWGELRPGAIKAPKVIERRHIRDAAAHKHRSGGIIPNRHVPDACGWTRRPGHPVIWLPFVLTKSTQPVWVLIPTAEHNHALVLGVPHCGVLPSLVALVNFGPAGTTAVGHMGAMSYTVQNCVSTLLLRKSHIYSSILHPSQQASHGLSPCSGKVKPPTLLIVHVPNIALVNLRPSNSNKHSS